LEVDRDAAAVEAGSTRGKVVLLEKVVGRGLEARELSVTEVASMLEGTLLVARGILEAMLREGD